MDVTVLGTGDAVGMPVPLCDCEYCRSVSRTRPSILVETDKTILFDVSPDARHQLSADGVTELDHICLTHEHFDHTGGVPELFHNTVPLRQFIANPYGKPDASGRPFGKEFSFTAPDGTIEDIADRFPWVADAPEMAFNSVSDRETFQCGETQISTVPLAHGRTPTVGYLVEHDGATVLYAPDMATLDRDVLPESIDLAVVEGSALVGNEMHGNRTDLTYTLRSISANQLVFVNISEHFAQRSACKMQDNIDETLGCGEIVNDGTTISL